MNTFMYSVHVCIFVNAARVRIFGSMRHLLRRQNRFQGPFHTVRGMFVVPPLLKVIDHTAVAQNLGNTFSAHGAESSLAVSRNKVRGGGSSSSSRVLQRGLLRLLR